jgi:hypothetical protein
MHRSSFGFHLVLFIAATVAIAARSGAAEPSVDDARKVAEQWLALVDAGRYDDSWAASASYFRSQVPQTEWKNAATAARAPLGALASRTFSAAESTHSLPGAPDGDYMVLIYDATFASGHARETVTPMRDVDGHWKVAGYFVQ